MIDPRRLLDDTQTTELQRSLLCSLSDEAPHRRARERTLAALGLPAAVGTTATLGAVARTSSASSAPAAGSAATSGALGVAGWVKWGAVLVGVTLVGGSGVAIATRASPAPTASAAAAPRFAEARPADPIESRLRTSETADVPVPTALPTLAPTDLPRVVVKSRPARSRTQQASAASSSGTLMEELTLMDRARQSLAQGSVGDAMRAVTTYEARYPHGSFVQEAEFIRVRALYEQHDDDAPRAARAFLTQYPSSPYAPRVRTLVGGAP